MTEYDSWIPFIEDGNTVVIPEVRPLTKRDIQRVIWTMVENDPNKFSVLEELRQKNQEVFEGTDTIGIILDGRSPDLDQGYLGDLIETTMLVNILRGEQKHVIIFTPHTDLFSGSEDSDVTIVTLPRETSASGLWPPDLNTKEFIYNNFGSMPFLVPINANMPVLIQMNDKDHMIDPQSVKKISSIVRRTNTEAELRLVVKQWAKAKINQRQALQTYSYLLGIDSVTHWDSLPNIYIHPDSKAKGFADAVIQLYACLPNSNLNPLEQKPVFFHPGVAPQKGKIENKFYPEDRWIKVLEEIKQLGIDTFMHPLIFLTPTDPTQANITKRLYQRAKELDYLTTQVPLLEVQQELGWSLGTFAAFIKRLAEANGIIVGVDSMPAGHLGPNLGMRSLVLGNRVYDPYFFCPPNNAHILLPQYSERTKDISPAGVASALKTFLLE